MSVIRASVTDQVLRITEAPVVAAGGKNEAKITFTFCDKWDGFTKAATFYREENNPYSILLDAENTCVVPWEVCLESGTFYIGVFGDKDGVRRTSTIVRYKVKKGAIPDGENPSEPTPDRIAQLGKEVEGVAADLQRHVEECSAGDVSAEVIEQVQSELYGLVPVEVEVGNLASSNGGLNPAPNMDRLRSNYFNSESVQYVASTDTNFVVYVYAYDADRAYLGTMGAWFSKVDFADVVKKYPTTAYLRIVVKRPTNATLTPEDVYGKIVCMRSKFITEPLVVAHPHAQYFQVTWNGIISLKPEFRGEPTKNMTSAVSDNGVGFAGSRNEELPEHLVIPEMVGNTAVTSIADGAFYCNMAIKTVTFPKTLNVIPMYCFRNTLLESIENAEHVTTIGEYAFHSSNLHRAYFPKLQTLGTSAFCQCSHLTYAHIGKVTEIPKDAFFKDRKLSCIDSECLVTSVGNTALYATSGLTSADFVKNLKSIGIGAFIQTGLDFDWGSLTDCTVESHGTPDEYNPTNFWSGLTPTACKNPLPTHMCQSDPRWVDRVVFTGFEDRNTWEYGCQLFAIMHIYCGLNQLYLSTVKEIEDLLESIQPGYLHNYGKGWSDIQRLCEPLGISVTEYAEFNAETLQALYDALKNGKYAIIGTSSGDDTMVGHVVVAYGVTANGKLLIADSGYQYRDDKTFGAKYSLPYKSVAIPKIGDITFCILSK